LAAPPVALGQYGTASEGAIAGTGAVELKRPAQLLRMKVQLISKGKNLKEALAALEKRKAAAIEQLAKLGAEKDSIHAEPPEIQVPDPNIQRQMEMMLVQRNRGKKKASKAASPASVVCWLAAEWKLSGEGADLLLAAHELEQKIKGADVGGAADAEKLSAEEQELLEEMQENFGQYSSNGEIKPGEPVFAYVSRITEKERDDALAEAFEKARKNAAILAKAAGMTLGEVRSVSSYGNPYNQGYRYDYNRMQQIQTAFGGGEDDDVPAQQTETMDLSPSAVRHVLSITASFEAKPAKSE
jgi:uncharacterized protein YggE